MRDGTLEKILRTLAKHLHRRGKPDLTEFLIGDKAYDGDPLDAKLQRHGITLVAPHRAQRRRKTQMADPNVATADAGTSKQRQFECLSVSTATYDGPNSE